MSKDYCSDCGLHDPIGIEEDGNGFICKSCLTLKEGDLYYSSYRVVVGTDNPRVVAATEEVVDALAIMESREDRYPSTTVRVVDEYGNTVKMLPSDQQACEHMEFSETGRYTTECGHTIYGPLKVCPFCDSPVVQNKVC